MSDPTSAANLTKALAKLDAVSDTLTVRRVFGDAYERDGVSIIPVAAVRGGGGGGGGEGSGPDEQGEGSGAGVGFGVTARPVGVFVVNGDHVTWTPSVDVSRIVLGAQLLALAGMLVFGRALARRRRHRH